MILADKITDLRKKNGWSQEELAEKLNVSRQAVSKWESAQSVPDMNRVLQLSALFGVSTDYLLKDELSEDPHADAIPAADTEPPLRRVSMEEAQDFLRHRETLARRIPLGVLMCILSPLALILLAVGQETGVLKIAEQQAVGLGLLALILLVGGAVALFVLSGVSGKRFVFMERESFETEYGVAGFVRERQARENGAQAALIAIGVVLCVISALPIFAAMLLPGENDFRYAVAVALLLCIVGCGVWMIVRASIRRGGYAILLEEGEYTRAGKSEQKRLQPVTSIYWGLVTTGYLAWSFITMDWQRTWIVWPVAGVLFGAVIAVAAAVRKNGRG
jgi:transcriptional regulator with XRE-family HTH domain